MSISNFLAPSPPPVTDPDAFGTVSRRRKFQEFFHFWFIFLFIIASTTPTPSPTIMPTQIPAKNCTVCLAPSCNLQCPDGFIGDGLDCTPDQCATKTCAWNEYCQGYWSKSKCQFSFSFVCLCDPDIGCGTGAQLSKKNSWIIIHNFLAPPPPPATDPDAWGTVSRRRKF